MNTEKCITSYQLKSWKNRSNLTVSKKLLAARRSKVLNVFLGGYQNYYFQVTHWRDKPSKLQHSEFLKVHCW